MKKQGKKRKSGSLRKSLVDYCSDCPFQGNANCDFDDCDERRNYAEQFDDKGNFQKHKNQSK